MAPPCRTWGVCFASRATGRGPTRAGASTSTRCGASRARRGREIVLCGYTSYPRDYDYAAFRAIADEVGAIAMADVSHVGGLIAGGALRNPFDDGFDVVTTTTHKSLRGPRGGLVLCRAAHAAAVDTLGLPRSAGRAAHERRRGDGGDVAQGGGAGVPRVCRAGPAQRPRARRGAAGARLHAGHRRHRQSHAGARHGRQLRHRRSPRRDGARPRRDHDQQADHPRRSQSAAAPERRPHRHAGGDHARHARSRHGAAGRVDRRRVSTR